MPSFLPSLSFHHLITASRATRCLVRSANGPEKSARAGTLYSTCAVAAPLESDATSAAANGAVYFQMLFMCLALSACSRCGCKSIHSTRMNARWTSTRSVIASRVGDCGDKPAFSNQCLCGSSTEPALAPLVVLHVLEALAVPGEGHSQVELLAV